MKKNTFYFLSDIFHSAGQMYSSSYGQMVNSIKKKKPSIFYTILDKDIFVIVFKIVVEVVSVAMVHCLK
jgi:hypothetical protein